MQAIGVLASLLHGGHCTRTISYQCSLINRSRIVRRWLFVLWSNVEHHLEDATTALAHPDHQTQHLTLHLTLIFVRRRFAMFGYYRSIDCHQTTQP